MNKRIKKKKAKLQMMEANTKTNSTKPKRTIKVKGKREINKSDLKLEISSETSTVSKKAKVTKKAKEGWMITPKSKKAHYFEDGKSACSRVSLADFDKNEVKLTDSDDRCKLCVNALNKG